MRKTSALTLAVCFTSLATISGCVAYPSGTYVYPYTPAPQVYYTPPSVYVAPVITPPVIYYNRPYPYYWSNRGYYLNGYWRRY